MQPKHLIIAAVAIACLAIAFGIRSRRIASPTFESTKSIPLADLTEGERRVYNLLREVQGHAILTENLIREGADAKAQLTLDTNKTTVSSLNINLSSLARKQKNEGLSDGAVKRGFTF